MGTFMLLFLSWSITNILVNGSILDRIRDYSLVKIKPLGKLLSCIMCSGFWVGLIVFTIFGDAHIVNSIGFGFVASGFSVIMNSLIIYFIKK